MKQIISNNHKKNQNSYIYRDLCIYLRLYQMILHHNLEMLPIFAKFKL